MTRPLAILRPEPGNSVTAERVRAAGLEPIAMPLFEVRAFDWAPPDPRGFDALLLTSANAPRHAGPGLAALAALPVLAVGPETARAAEAAGLNVVEYGQRDLAALLARQPASQRLLWLAGRDRIGGDHSTIRAIVPVYASEAMALSTDRVRELPGAVALLHSARAGRQLGAELDRHALPRSSVRIAAISARAADAAGKGWGRVALAAAPNDAALIAAAGSLAIDP